METDDKLLDGFISSHEAMAMAKASYAKGSIDMIESLLETATTISPLVSEAEQAHLAYVQRFLTEALKYTPAPPDFDALVADLKGDRP